MNILIDVSFGEDYVLDPHQVRLAAGIERLGDLRDRHVRELPTVTNLDDPRARSYLISTLRDSIRKKERLWLIPMTDEALASWQAWLPELLLTEVGPRQEVDGQEITPVGIAPLRLVEGLTDRGSPDDLDFLQSALHGIDGLAFSRRVYKKVLAAGLKIVPRGKFVRTFTNPRVIAYAVVLTYSALRALPVTFVKQFQGSILMLWTIDLVTAVPYTWGALTMVTAAKFRMRMIGLAVTIITFIMPYVYFAMYGRHYPPHVIAIIVLLILSTFALEAYKIGADKRVFKTLAKRVDD